MSDYTKGILEDIKPKYECDRCGEKVYTVFTYYFWDKKIDIFGYRLTFGSLDKEICNDCHEDLMYNEED